jgi:hypothetical protein
MPALRGTDFGGLGRTGAQRTGSQQRRRSGGGSLEVADGS